MRFLRSATISIICTSKKDTDQNVHSRPGKIQDRGPPLATFGNPVQYRETVTGVGPVGGIA